MLVRTSLETRMGYYHIRVLISYISGLSSPFLKSSSLLLKVSTVLADIPSSLWLFHLLTTLCEKKNFMLLNMNPPWSASWVTSCSSWIVHMEELLLRNGRQSVGNSEQFDQIRAISSLLQSQQNQVFQSLPIFKTLHSQQHSCESMSTEPFHY